MILGKPARPALLYVAGVIVILSIMLSFVWAKHHEKTIVPATAPLHEKKVANTGTVLNMPSHA